MNWIRSNRNKSHFYLISTLLSNKFDMHDTRCNGNYRLILYNSLFYYCLSISRDHCLTNRSGFLFIHTNHTTKQLNNCIQCLRHKRFPAEISKICRNIKNSSIYIIFNKLYIVWKGKNAQNKPYNIKWTITPINMQQIIINIKQ